MTTRFVQVSWGLSYTQVFLHISNIKAYIQSFQNGREVDSTTKLSESIAYSAQDRMEEEIAQHIRVSDQLAKDELFDYLDGWVMYFESFLNNPKALEPIINNYNSNRLVVYEKIILEEEQKFKNTNNYKKLNHLDFYEVEHDFGRLAGHIFNAFYNQKNRLEQYRKFFEAPDPDLIDIEFLPQYLDIINPIISRCVSIAKKRLNYLKGDNEKKQLPSSETNTPPVSIPVPTGRLKVSVSAEEFAVLMRLLHECDVIISSKGEIHDFVANHIQTPGMAKKRISSSNFGKLFSSKNSEIRNFWIGRLTKMIDKASKK